MLSSRKFAGWRFIMKKAFVIIGILGLASLGLVLAQGIMGGYSQGMMGGMRMAIYTANAKPLPDTKAYKTLGDYAARYGTNIKLKDIMTFSENVYAQVVDAKTGAGYFEILFDRYSGTVQPEPGPNMMWNTQYGMGWDGTGMMGNNGMMGNAAAPTQAAVRYAEPAAQKLATQFLSSYLPNTKLHEGQAFPGYYTYDYGRGEIEGMLSVNAYTGEIRIHTWHGSFIMERM
jgi:hypothetical protein